MSVGEIEIIDQREGEPDEIGGFPVPHDYASDPHFARLPADLKVEILRFQGWRIDQIARAAKIRIRDVEYHCRRIDRQMESMLGQKPDEVRSWHQRWLREIVVNVMTNPEARTNPKLYNVAMHAMSDERKMLGLDAPDRSLNLNLSARTVISPDQQQALIHDPEYRSHLLAIEELERRAAQKPGGHVAGPVRGGGLEGEVAGDPAPAPAERPDAQGGDGADRPADGLHAPEAWEVDVPLALVPGVVPGDVPRSEGDLGEL